MRIWGLGVSGLGVQGLGFRVKRCKTRNMLKPLNATPEVPRLSPLQGLCETNGGGVCRHLHECALSAMQYLR